MGFFGRRGGKGNRGLGGGLRDYQQYPPPDSVVELGFFTHTAKDDIVCTVTHENVPYFSTPIYFENKQMIGKVAEVFGTTSQKYISIKLTEDLRASSFIPNTKIYINPEKMVPLRIFVPELTKTRRKRGSRKGRGRKGGMGKGGGRSGDRRSGIRSKDQGLGFVKH